MFSVLVGSSTLFVGKNISEDTQEMLILRNTVLTRHQKKKKRNEEQIRTARTPHLKPQINEQRKTALERLVGKLNITKQNRWFNDNLKPKQMKTTSWTMMELIKDRYSHAPQIKMVYHN